MSTDRSPFRGTTCWDNTFTAYHDPNVHILLTAIFGIFTLVFFYYFVTRRPKAEYFFLVLFCALETGAFVVRIYGEIVIAMIGLIIASAAIAISLCVVYMLYARWTEIADRYYGEKKFNLVMFHPAFPTVFLILIIGLIIAGIWIPSIMWVVFLAMYFAIWVTTIVALIRHRRHRPSHPERTIVMSQRDGDYNTTPIVTSHKLLDNMMVMLVVLNSIMLVKTIFLTVAFGLVLLYFIAPLYYVFDVLEDLAFVVILASPQAVQLFEPRRHVPEMRNEVAKEDAFNPLPPSNHHYGQPDMMSAPYANQSSTMPQPASNPNMSAPYADQSATMPQPASNPNMSAPYANQSATMPQPAGNHSAITMPNEAEANRPVLNPHGVQPSDGQFHPVAY